MIILDTSFLIAFYNKRDSRHEKALKIFDEITNDKLVISDYIFDEIVTFLRAKVPWIAIEVGENILENLDMIRVNDEDFRTAWELFNKFDELSFTDCTTLSLSKRLKIRRVVTFDQALSNAFAEINKK
ncbi:PilT protein domain protein [Sulfolobus islandicus L.S.2.15]|uniref:PilT protein domain protein n=1 Tax=Saccharolobus islandicus (strain L.S.2.15 / Lassen \|nr:PIN domain-containing protein [Sulfolobus islandicus]ACP34663.1 PilT protein domain protein [Sulfolobus islandicus L.S.2.15]